MRYDTVLAYTQVDYPTFKNFRLPVTMPEEPTPNDTAVVQRCGCGRWRSRKRHQHGRVQLSSPLPTLTSRADSASNDSSDDDNDGSNNVGQL